MIYVALLYYTPQSYIISRQPANYQPCRLEYFATKNRLIGQKNTLGLFRKELSQVL